MTVQAHGLGITIEAIEYYLPEQVEDGLALKRDNPDWRMDDIEKKTGIHKRHISGHNQTAVDLAVLAAEKLFNAGTDRSKIDVLILVTQSPDYLLPTSACLIQNRLGLSRRCLAFDVNQGCSGFVYGLAIGGSLIESGFASRVLLICSETYSKYIDKSDRTCRPIFSDGAAATVLAKAAAAAVGPFELGSDGSGAENLMVQIGGARKNQKASGGDLQKPCLRMNGAEVFMFTMSEVPKCVQSLLKKSGKSTEDVDLFVFHQASKIVIDNVMRHLVIPEKKVFRNYQDHGNTVSATIPIALADAVRSGRLKKDDLVLLAGFGVGYSWGACLIRWGEPASALSAGGVA